MQTLRTAVVVVLLLTITYSAYVALTAPPAELPPEMLSIIEGDLHEFGPDDFDIGIPGDLQPLTPDGFSQGDAEGQTGVEYRLSDATPDFPSNDLASIPPTPVVPTVDSGSPDLDNSFDAQNSAAVPPADLGVVAGNGQASVDQVDGQQVVSSGASVEIPSIESAFADVRSGASGNPSISVPSVGEETPLAASPDTSIGGATSSEDPASMALRTSLANAVATADRQCEKDQLREALLTLSLFHNTPGMTDADREALLPRLDFLAGEVIYSKRHLLEQPYRVTQGESLQDIAAKLGVPWQLLGTVNEISDPAAVVPGTELKVIRGPFRAEVNLSTDELTLFLGELYAGRFPIKAGANPAPQPGAYVVRDKQTARNYYAGDGPSIPAGDPRNPYGDVWLDLGEQMCIHGSTGTSVVGGCIELRAADAKDIYGILSQGSDVTILR